MTKKLINRMAENAVASPGLYEAGSIQQERVGAEFAKREATRLGRLRFFVFEADGDFNPGWAVFCIFCVLVIAINVAGFLTVPMHPDSWPVLVALLATDVLCMWLSTALTVNIARAKVIVSGATKGVGSITSVGGGPAGVAVNLFGDNQQTDDERDESDL